MIAGNWKMNGNYAEAVVLAQDISDNLKELDPQTTEVVVCPPMVDLKGVGAVIDFDHAPFALGAQNVYYQISGAYTGETSPDMLKNLGCSYCIIGHSERRMYFHETDEDVNLKARALMDVDIKPIICVGEPVEQREAGLQVSYVLSQVQGALKDIQISKGDELVIAYEPIWAIGTGKTATPDDAQEVIGAIRDELLQLYGVVANKVRILYGGSAKPENILGFVGQPDIDGALVGGASLNADAFCEMVKRVDGDNE